MQKKNNFLPFILLLFVLVLIGVVAIKYTVVTTYVDDFKEVASSPVQKPLVAPEGMVAIKGMVFSGAQVQGENDL